MGRFFRVVALSAVFLAGYFAPPAHGNIRGKEAPNFKLPAADGTSLELKQFAGKVVVVNFWATWCGPCRAEIPGMLKVYNQYKAKGLEIVGIALDDEGWDVVKPFAKKMNITYPLVLGNQRVTQAYGGIRGIPTTFVINRKGVVAAQHVGYFSAEEFEKVVKPLL